MNKLKKEKNTIPKYSSIGVEPATLEALMKLKTYEQRSYDAVIKNLIANQKK